MNNNPGPPTLISNLQPSGHYIKPRVYIASPNANVVSNGIVNNGLHQEYPQNSGEIFSPLIS